MESLRIYGQLFVFISTLSVSVAGPKSTLDAATSEEIKTCIQLLARPTFKYPLPFSTSKPSIVIVDGYSSGRFLAAEFRRKGFQIIHIHSHGKPPMLTSEKTFWKENFELDIPYHGNKDELLNLLNRFNITAVLAGADSGVLFADELSFELSKFNPMILSNGVDLARKDKFLMSERLRELGIDSVKQIKTRKIDEALDWVRKNQLLTSGHGIVVVKPLTSGSADGVLFLRTEKEIENAFRTLIDHPNEYGENNTEILIQEYLEGDEYVVNTTGLNGIHQTTDIWLYRKRPTPDGLKLTYSVDELLPFEGPIQDILIKYNLRVLAALGVLSGNGHAEIKIVPGRGPVLVETNIRMMGSGLPILSRFATGHSQIDRTIMAYTDPDKFLRHISPYKLRKNAAVVTFTHFKETKGIINQSAAAEFMNIPGYLYHSFNSDDGETVEGFKDLNSTAGDVWLLDESTDTLKTAIRRIREMESDGSIIQASQSDQHGEDSQYQTAPIRKH